MAGKTAEIKKKTSTPAQRERPGTNGPAHISQLQPRKQPRQQRARATVDAILRASAELFANAGYAGTTTNKIAARAGVSVGSLYQYFPGKDAILSTLFQQHHAEMTASVHGSLALLADPSVPLHDAFAELLERMVAVHEQDPDLVMALSEENLHLAGAHKHHEDEERRFVAITAEILAGRPDVRAGDHKAMAHLLVEATGHLVRWLVHDAPPEVDRRQAVDELTLLLSRYLAP